MRSRPCLEGGTCVCGGNVHVAVMDQPQQLSLVWLICRCGRRHHVLPLPAAVPADRSSALLVQVSLLHLTTYLFVMVTPDGSLCLQEVQKGTKHRQTRPDVGQHRLHRYPSQQEGECPSPQRSEILVSSGEERHRRYLLLCLKKLNDESIMRSLLEIKTPVRSAARSYILTSPESSNVGILEVRLYLCRAAFTRGG